MTVRVGSPRKNSRYVPKRSHLSKPCPTCYAVMVRELGGWVCEGVNHHRLTLREAEA